MARLKDYYRKEVVPALVKQFGYASVMQVPRLEKIVLNMGVGEATGDKKFLENAVADMHSTDETLLKIRADDSIDIMVVDLALDGDAVGLIKQVRHLNPAVRVLIYTASDSPQDIFAAMDAGADAYVLKENLRTVLETAIRSARLGTVWLDPGIARQVLQIMETAASTPSRVLPTGFMPMPLMPDEQSILSEVAASACTDGVCMVDPSFVRKLKRFARAASE